MLVLLWTYPITRSSTATIFFHSLNHQCIQRHTIELAMSLSPTKFRKFLTFYTGSVNLRIFHFQYFEYLKVRDYANGYITVSDFRNLNMLKLASKMNPVELHQTMTAIVVSVVLVVGHQNIFSSDSLLQTLILTKNVNDSIL